jgi:hypothetical protein
MQHIQPVTLWFQGTTKTANIYDLSIVNDDLSTRASLYYRLGAETVPAEGEPSIIWLQDGNLTITGQDYQDWDADPSANEWIYNWSANQLNITLI